MCVLTHDDKFDVPAIVAALRHRRRLPRGHGLAAHHRAAGRAAAGRGRHRRSSWPGCWLPIGLDLGARTPEETAVAICAEIIAERTGPLCAPSARRRRPHPLRACPAGPGGGSNVSMASINRVLDAEPVLDLATYEAGGGGEALRAARASEPVAIIEVVEASGLRGRGGAGFPTGTKWRTVAGLGGAEPATVVVNAAEGEPGTLKDRTLLRRNPYKVLEGALIAAHAVAADQVVVAMKSSEGDLRARVESAIADSSPPDGPTTSRSTCAPGRSATCSARRPRCWRPSTVAHRSPGWRPRIGPGPRTSAPTPRRRLAGPWPTRPAAPAHPPPWSTTWRRWPTCPPSSLDGPEAFRSLGTAESPGHDRVHGQRPHRAGRRRGVRARHPSA